MSGLLIKDLPEELRRKLEARAAAYHRSSSGEAIRILKSVLHDRSAPPTLDEIDQFRARGKRPLRQAIIDRARRRDR
jgi:plasmid stability protein